MIIGVGVQPCKPKRTRETDIIAKLNCYGKPLVEKRPFLRVTRSRGKPTAKVIKGGCALGTSFLDAGRMCPRMCHDEGCAFLNITIIMIIIRIYYYY